MNWKYMYYICLWEKQVCKRDSRPVVICNLSFFKLSKKIFIYKLQCLIEKCPNDDAFEILAECVACFNDNEMTNLEKLLITQLNFKVS